MKKRQKNNRKIVKYIGKVKNGGIVEKLWQIPNKLKNFEKVEYCYVKKKHQNMVKKTKIGENTKNFKMW